MPRLASTTPGRIDLAHHLENLGALGVFGALGFIPFGAVDQDDRHLDSDSTLLTMVGLYQTPTWPGKGGFTRGLPRSPWMDSMSAVSSPQT